MDVEYDTKHAALQGVIDAISVLKPNWTHVFKAYALFCFFKQVIRIHIKDDGGVELISTHPAYRSNKEHDNELNVADPKFFDQVVDIVKDILAL